AQLDDRLRGEVPETNALAIRRNGSRCEERKNAKDDEFSHFCSRSVSHRTIEVLRLVEVPGRIKPGWRDKLGRHQIGARKVGAGDDGAGEIRTAQVGARQ